VGTLTELDVDDVTPATGTGAKLVNWWRDADTDDRATLRRWDAAGVGSNVIAERITAAGFPISQHTVMYGLRLLRRLPEWEA
jgi:hypothetical protein